MAARQRILVASANPWSFALATERDIIRSAIAGGAQVDLIDMFTLSASASPHWRARDVAVERFSRKIARFVRPLINGRDLTSELKPSSDVPAVSPDDVRAMRDYRVDGAAVGLAVLSSITSVTTIQEADSFKEYGLVLPAAWRSAHLSQQVGRLVAARGYDEAVIFNGRHAYSRPFCDAMEAAGARVWRYEQGAVGTSYVMAPQSIHHPDTVAEMILGHRADTASGRQFYRDRISRVAGDPVNFFVNGQVVGSLPAGLDAGRYVSFFSSSSDEMFAITDDIGFGAFPTQYEAVLALGRACRSAGLGTVVRLHPHLKYKHPSWRREWDFDALRQHNVIVIQPGDPCDSYALAAGSHAVLSCGSTVGFECSYRGIANADVGRWVGSLLGAMPALMTEADITSFVRSPYILPSAHQAALKYGSYVRTAGRQLEELDPGTTPNRATIDGRLVDPVRAIVEELKTFAGRGPRNAAGTTAGKVWIDPTVEDRMQASLESRPEVARRH